MALGRRQHYNSDLRDKERNSLGTEWKTENDCIGSHVFYICAPSLRKKSRIVKTAGAEWKEEITNMFPDFTVAWETGISAASFWAAESLWSISQKMVLMWWTGAVFPLHLFPILWAAAQILLHLVHTFINGLSIMLSSKLPFECAFLFYWPSLIHLEARPRIEPGT